MGVQVFISFARPSGWAPALALRQALKDLGLSAFVDQEDRALGHPWDPQLQAAQQAAKLTLVVLTPETIESPHQNSEIQRAVTWSRHSGAPHMVVPWATASAPPVDRWPSGLARFPAVDGDVREVARQLFLTLHPQASTAGRPSDEAIGRAAAWLDDQLPTIASRRQALRGLSSLDPALTWTELLPRLDLDTICRLIEALEEPTGVDVVDNLRRSVDAPVWAPANLKPEIEAAYADLKAEQYAKAEERLKRLLETAQLHEQLTHSLRARLLSALTGQGKADEALDLIAQIDPAQLNDGDRERLARRLLLWERWDEAAAAAPRSQVIAQLVTILRDGEVPEGLASDSEVQLRAGFAHLAGGRLHAAARCAEAAWALGDLTEHGKQGATHLVLAALAAHWEGAAPELLVAPGRYLHQIDLWESAHGPWNTLDGLRSVVEQYAVRRGQDEDSAARARDAEATPDPSSPIAQALHEALRQPGLDKLRDVVAAHPTVGLVQFVWAGALLSAGQLDAAIAAAERAHAALPGRGQRLRLAIVLGARGRRAEADALIADIEPPTADWWRARVRFAPDAAEQRRRAIAWTEDEPRRAEAWVERCAAAHSLGALDEARDAAWHALRSGQLLATAALKLLGQVALHTPEDRPMVRALVARLDARRASDPEAEGLRMWLLLGDPAASATPVDWGMLTVAGAAKPVALDALVEVLRTRQAVTTMVDQGWAAGLLCHAAWRHLRELPVGASGQAALQGQLRVPPPMPSARPPEACAGRPVLIDLLGLEIIAAEQLCDAVDAHIGALVTFEDVIQAVESAAVTANRPAMRRELTDLSELWRPVEAAPRSPLPPTLTDVEAPAVRAWLRAWGHPVQGQDDPAEARPAPWAPPPGGVVLGGAAVIALGADLGTFARACAEQRVPIALAEDDLHARQQRQNELRDRLEAADIAERLADWLRGLRATERLRPIPRPPPFVPLSEAAADSAVGWLWSHRGALEADDALILVTAEQAEWGTQGVPSPRALNGWGTAEERLGVLNRLHRLSQRAEVRVCALSSLLRAVCPAEKWPGVADRLVALGHVESWAAEDIAAMLVGRDALSGPGLERKLNDWTAWLQAESWGPDQLWLSFDAGHRVLGPALLKVWDARAEPSAIPNAFNILLQQVEMLERRSRGRAGLAAHAITGLLAKAAEQPRRAVSMTLPDGMRFSAESDLGALIATLASWAAASATGSAAVQTALCALADHMPETRATTAVLSVVVAGTRGLAHGVDLSGPAWAALLQRTDASTLLEILHEGGRSLRDWLNEALQSHPWQIDGLAVIAEVRPSDSAAPVEVRLPLSATLDQQGPAELNVVAALVRAQDAAVAGALRAHAAAPTPETQAALRTALDRSPVPWLRLHPLSILRWTLFSEASAPWPRTLEELRGLLGEPTPWISAPDARLKATLDAEQAAQSFDLRPLIYQLTALPGVFLGLAARAEPRDENGLVIDVLERFSRRIEDHAQHPVGVLAASLFALSRAGAQTRVQRLGEREVTLPRLAAELAAAALAPEEPPPRRAAPTRAEVGAAEATRPVDAPALVPQTYALLESGLLRAADAVIGQLGGSDRVSDAERTHLGWRLCAWWSAQAERTADPAGALRALAATAAAPVGPPSAELFDPRRFGPGAVDLRELILVQVLYVVAVGADRGDYALDWDRALPALHRIASRAPSPAERALRAASTTCTFGSPLLCAPDLALATLMKLDRGILELAEPLVRLRWLDGSLDANDAPAHLWALRDETLLALTLRPALRSPAERRLLEEQLGGAQALRPARRRALLRLSGVCPGLAGPALEVLRQALRSGETAAAAEALGDALFARAGTDDAVTLLDAVLDEVRAAALSDAQLRAALVPLALGRGRGQVAALAARLWPGAPAPTVDALLHSPAQGAED